MELLLVLKKTQTWLLGHTSGIAQIPITPVPGPLTASPDFYGQCTCVVHRTCIHIYTHKL